MPWYSRLPETPRNSDLIPEFKSRVQQDYFGGERVKYHRIHFRGVVTPSQLLSEILSKNHNFPDQIALNRATLVLADFWQMTRDLLRLGGLVGEGKGVAYPDYGNTFDFRPRLARYIERYGIINLTASELAPNLRFEAPGPDFNPNENVTLVPPGTDQRMCIYHYLDYLATSALDNEEAVNKNFAEGRLRGGLDHYLLQALRKAQAPSIVRLRDATQAVMFDIALTEGKGLYTPRKY